MENFKSVWNMLVVQRLNSIFVKYFILVFIICVIPLSIISIAISLYIESNSDNEIKYAYEQSLLKISDTLDIVIDDVSKLSTRLSSDNEIIQMVSSNETAENYDFKHLVDSVRTKINLPTSQYIDSIYVYSQLSDYILSSDGFYESISDFYDKSCINEYSKIVQGMEKLIQYRLADIKKPPTETKENFITSIQTIPVNGLTKYGAIIINVDIKDINWFEHFIREENTKKIGDVYIINSNKTVIYSKSMKYIGHNAANIPYFKEIEARANPSVIIKTGSQKELFVYVESRLTGYSYLSVVPIDNQSNTAYLRMVFISFLAAGVLFSAILAFVISWSVYRPFGDIISIINHPYDLDEATLTLKKKRWYELRYIFSTFYNINSNKKDLEANLSNNLYLLKKSQTIALQSQINPHFLYNTLNAIKWMVMEYTQGENEASKAITTLSHLLRLSLETSENLISIKLEIEHAKEYISIEKLRFEDMFEVRWEIPEDVLEFMIVKITLQPIIENSIYHGVKHLEGKGIITIRAANMEDVIIFEIEDNGPGIEPGELEYINNELQQESIKEDFNIGLKNVNERIRLIFGEAYGLRLYSEKNKGTWVKIVIPKVK